MCTLLGPEGPDLGGTERWLRGTFLWTFVLYHRMPAKVVSGRGYRPYFENYTVDASIYILATRNQAFGSGFFSEGVICINDFPGTFGCVGKALVFLQFC